MASPLSPVSSNIIDGNGSANNSSSDDSGNGVGDDIAISPIEGYSEIKMISSPFSAAAMIPSSESSEGSSENIVNLSTSNSPVIKPEFNGSDIPQWKRDLIQRRKNNIARTIGANQSGTGTLSCPIKGEDNNPSQKRLLQSPSSSPSSSSSSKPTAVSQTTSPVTLLPSTSSCSTNISNSADNLDKITIENQSPKIFKNNNNENNTKTSQSTLDTPTSPNKLLFKHNSDNINFMPVNNNNDNNDDTDSNNINNYIQPNSPTTSTKNNVDEITTKGQYTNMIDSPTTIVFAAAAEIIDEATTNTIPSNNQRKSPNILMQENDIMENLDCSSTTTSNNPLTIPIPKQRTSIKKSYDNNMATSPQHDICSNTNNYNSNNITKGTALLEQKQNEKYNISLTNQLHSRYETDKLNIGSASASISDKIDSPCNTFIVGINENSAKNNRKLLSLSLDTKTCGNNTPPVKVQKLITTQSVSPQGFIKNPTVNKNSAASINKYIAAAAAKNNTNSIIQKSPKKLPSSLPSSSSNFKQNSSNNKMVAVQEIILKSNNTNDSSVDSVTTTTTIDSNKGNGKKNDEFNDFDPSEELQYGPGIVSKLRCRYLSLALRQSSGKQRLPLDNLRRATSLNNLLDGGTGVGVTTNNSPNTNGTLNDCEDDFDNLIINSNHYHTNATKNNCKNVSWSIQSPQNGHQNGQQNNLKEIQKEQEQQITVSSNSCSPGGDYVEKPDNDDNEQPQQKNSFSNNNNKKLNVQQQKPSAASAEKNIIKTGCSTNYDHNNQYIKNTGGIIRSGRHVKRGNDSLKRARSVEALLCEKSSWSNPLDDDDVDEKVNYNKEVLNGQQHKKDNNTLMSVSANSVLHWNNHSPNGAGSPISAEVTIEDKILNARDRMHHEKHPPKRLTPIIDDTERPPPDVVKQTLKIFEASANRRGNRGLSRNHQNGQVATKVANYKSIISQEKPPITFPKPPLSPKRISANSSGNHGKNKPTSLNIKNGSPSSSNKFNKNFANSNSNKSISNSGNSPVSNLTKKFNSQQQNTDDIRNNENKSPAASISSPTNINNSIQSLYSRQQQQRNESTPIRITPEIRAPDLIPRKVFETNLGISPVADDSPLTHLIQKNDRLKTDISSPIQTTSKYPESDDTSDDDDSVDGNDELVIKRISKSALENISKAGTTQHFSFKNKTSSLNLGGTSSSSSSSVEPLLNTTKQIGIIRPLVAEPKINSNNHQTEETNKTLDTDVMKSAVAIPAIVNPPQPQKRGDNLVITNLSQTKPQQQQQKPSTNNSSNLETFSTNSIDLNKPLLTTREIEKNLINEKKNELANLESGSSSCNNGNNNNSNSISEPIWQQLCKKKSGQASSVAGGITAEAQNNIMVFNFKDRKDVPDYIENDGLFIKRRRELPKPNESGFVLLGDLSLETSTDPDDSWMMSPPSPCNVEFENANIIINGKSSIRYRSKDMSLRVQFDDTLTSTFEYPSESSFLEESIRTPTPTKPTTTMFSSPTKEEIDSVIDIFTDLKIRPDNIQVEEIIPIPIPIQSQKPLGNMPLGSAPLGSYTPVKLQLETQFELGITRVPNSSNDLSDVSSKESIQQNGHNSSTLTENDTNNVIIKNGTSNDDNYSSTSSSNNKSTNGICAEAEKSTEPESLQYLKPATDDLTVVYSEGTQKTDLLY